MTKASPESISTLAVTSRVTPRARIRQPATSATMRTAYRLGTKADSSAMEPSTKTPKIIDTGICSSWRGRNFFRSSRICSTTSRVLKKMVNTPSEGANFRLST